MKKQYIKPVTTVQPITVNHLMAASGPDQDPTTKDDSFWSQYGNEGEPGSDPLNGISGTGSAGDSEFTQGAKHNYNVWDDEL